MNNKTPQKANINGEYGSKTINASVLTFVKSPLVASPNVNLTGTRRVAKDIAANVHNSIQKWNNFHLRGHDICTQIVNLKLNNSQEKFPDGLENLCFDLVDVLDELEKVTETLQLLDSQMSTLNKQSNNQTKLFITGNMEHLATLVTAIVEAYKKEYLVKDYVRRIAHVKLINVPFLCICWTYQTNLKSIDAKVDALLYEVGLKI